jgi:hypothetical protein
MIKFVGINGKIAQKDLMLPPIYRSTAEGFDGIEELTPPLPAWQVWGKAEACSRGNDGSGDDDVDVVGMRGCVNKPIK